MAFRRRRGRYGGIKVTIDGVRFDSKVEAAVAGILEIRKRLGEIRDYEHHPPSECLLNLGEKRSHQLWYQPDYLVTDNDGNKHWLDAKAVNRKTGKLLMQRPFRILCLLWLRAFPERPPLMAITKDGILIDPLERQKRRKKK